MQISTAQNVFASTTLDANRIHRFLQNLIIAPNCMCIVHVVFLQSERSVYFVFLPLSSRSTSRYGVGP